MTDPVELDRLEQARLNRQVRELTRSTPTSAELQRIFPCRRLEDGTWEITGYRGAATEVIVPAVIGKSPVTSIGRQAFCAGSYTNVSPLTRERRAAIVSIVLPEGIRTIGEGAFAHCPNLSSVTLPSTLVSLSFSAFSSCRSLTAISIPPGVPEVPLAELGYSSIRDVTILGSETTLSFRRPYCGWYCSQNAISAQSFHIRAPAGSCAERWARENSVPFQLLSPAP